MQHFGVPPAFITESNTHPTEVLFVYKFNMNTLVMLVWNWLLFMSLNFVT